MLFVTHNLALVRSIAARVQILNEGRVVESGSVVEVMDSPQEDYTEQLLANSPTHRRCQPGPHDRGRSGLSVLRFVNPHRSADRTGHDLPRRARQRPEAAARAVGPR